jgi:hypothetical protein
VTHNRLGYIARKRTWVYNWSHKPKQRIRNLTPEQKAQKQAYDREYAKRPEVTFKQKVRSAAYRKRPDVKAKYLPQHLHYRYGLTLEQYDNLLCEQGGCCAICKLDPETATPGLPVLHVDHNHKTGEVRGLLCGKCNMAIGLLMEDQDNLANASRYLLRG